MFPAGETVTRLRPTITPDPYKPDGPGRIDWSNPDRLEISGVAFAPTNSSRVFELDRSPVETSAALYVLDVAADFKAGDRVEVRGGTYAVDGKPEHWRSPYSGWEAGLVVPLLEVDDR